MFLPKMFFAQVSYVVPNTDESW